MSSKKDYKTMFKKIRNYVSFNFDLRKQLSTSAKSIISRYYNAINKLKNRPHQEFKPRKKENLQTAKEFAHQGMHLPKLKTAFIPTPTTDKVKIKIKNGEVVIKTPHVESSFIAFDVENLTENPEEYVWDLVAFRSENYYSIVTTTAEIPATYHKNFMPREVAKFVAQYTDANRWLLGLNAHTFKNQASIDEYVQDLQSARKERAKKRESARKQKARKRGRKTKQGNLGS